MILGSHHYVQLSELKLSSNQPEPSDFLSVKALAASGAAVPDVCKERLQKIFPRSVGYVNGYGQTENGLAISGLQEFEGLGMLSPGVSLKVVPIRIRHAYYYCFDIRE